MKTYSSGYAPVEIVTGRLLEHIGGWIVWAKGRRLCKLELVDDSHPSYKFRAISIKSQAPLTDAERMEMDRLFLLPETSFESPDGKVRVGTNKFWANCREDGVVVVRDARAAERK